MQFQKKYDILLYSNKRKAGGEKMKSFTAGKNDAGQRADKFLEKAVPLLPKNLMYRYIRTKRIKINGRRCEISQRIQEGDIIELYINDEFFESASNTPAFMSAPPKIDIVYEDENIILVNKKCGLVVHDDDRGTTDTLINRIQHYLYDKGEYDHENELSFAPALCNRLDRNTSGLVICAKNAESLRILSEKIKYREISKHYLCLTCGVPFPNEATETAYLEKDENTKTVHISNKKTENSKTVITKYKVLRQNGELALCEVDLITGRTHQIRAHMAHLGYPILGDGKYGSNEVNRRYKIKTQALHAYRLKFEFTTDAGPLSYLDGREFQTPQPWFVNEYL